MRRRRFIALAASFAAAPGAGRAATWQGRALGAEVSVRIDGAGAEAALAGIPEFLGRVEAAFSLYDPGSELSALNRDGRLRRPSAWMRDLLGLAGRAHDLTGGLFDPTVQPLWRALAEGGDAEAARAAIGWRRVRAGPEVALGAGQALTFNGIAQGFATDLVRDRLLAMGARRALVDIGEQAAIGGPFRLGLVDPAAGYVGPRTLRDGAVATSSPGALRLGRGASHIVAPDRRGAIWSTVSVGAGRAALADALSTAAVFMPAEALAALRREAKLDAIVAVAPNGDVRTF